MILHLQFINPTHCCTLTEANYQCYSLSEMITIGLPIGYPEKIVIFQPDTDI